MSTLTKKAIKDVTRRKLRTLLTVLGIAVGIMGLSAITIASNQLNSSFQYSADASSQPDIQLTTSPAPASLVGELAQQPNVRRVEAGGVETTRWAIPSGHFPFVLNGVADFHAIQQITAVELVAGRLPGAGEILMESSDRTVQPVRVSDAITLTIRGQPQRLIVSGLARTRGLPSASFLGAGFGYMREADLEARFQLSGVNRFFVQVHDYSQRNATARALTHTLESHGLVILGATIGHTDNGLKQITNGLLAIMQVLAIVALVLSIFLLLSTITTLITEQVPIIGTMKAIGADRRQVMRTYLTSVAIYGVVGTALGLALGIFVGNLLVSFVSALFNMDVSPFSINPSLVLVSAAVGVGVPLVAALLPIYVGTRISVREALSGFGLDGGAGARGRRVGAYGRTPLRHHFGFIPQTMQLGVRSLLRKRTRALLTLLALSLAGTCFLAIQTTAHSFSAFLDQELGIYNFDVDVSFPNPAPYDKVQQVLDTVPGIKATERASQQLVHTRWGDAVLTGLEPDGRVYRQQMIAGRWFTASDTNVVVLSDHAASHSGLNVGDMFSFHNDLHSATWTVIGIARDDNAASLKMGTVLASVAQVSAFGHLPPDYLDTIYVQSTSGTVSDVDALASRLDDALSRAGYQAALQTRQQVVQTNQSEFVILEALLYSVAGIVALVGAIGLFNALAMSVLERRREIGILRAIGATGRKVGQVFWTEGVFLGVAAWLIAIALGIPAAYGFVQVLGNVLVILPFAFDPLSLLWMLGFIVVVASVASLGPVWGASRVKVAQTLRYE
jgi:putative ABC transport system permease protein